MGDLEKELSGMTHKQLSKIYHKVEPAKTKKAFIKNIIDYVVKDTVEPMGVDTALDGHKPNGTVDDLLDALEDAKSGNEEKDEQWEGVDEPEGEMDEAMAYLEEGSEAQKIAMEEMAASSATKKIEKVMMLTDQHYKLLEFRNDPIQEFSSSTFAKQLPGGVVHREVIMKGSGCAVSSFFIPAMKIRVDKNDPQLHVLYK